MNTLIGLLLIVVAVNDPGGDDLIDPSASQSTSEVTIRVGSKGFTENDILAHIAVLLAKDAGNATRFQPMSGSSVPWNALLNGSIDVYPDYTGTITEALLKQPDLKTVAEIRSALAERNIGMTDPIGFANNYAIGMTDKQAEDLGINRISQLADHPELKFGFSIEFMKRREGWPTFSQTYRLTDRRPTRLEHGLAYPALTSGTIQVTDVYSTDPKIATLNMRVLDDDFKHFPEYEAVYLYRLDLEESAPAVVKSLQDMAGKIGTKQMIAMNGRAENPETGRTSEQVAGAFLGKDIQSAGLWARLWRTTKAHLFLVIMSLSAAIVVAIPLGVVAAKVPMLEHVILVSAEIIQTIPGLALLVLLMPVVASVGFPSIGPTPAIVALFLYSLLPIIRNTHTGMRDIPNSVRESAAVLGLRPASQLWLVELPMASRMILAGIKTTAAINVGYATLGGLIGAGGYGEPILTGLQTQNTREMLEGAIPAALMALGVKVLLEGVERVVVPHGLRIESK